MVLINGAQASNVVWQIGSSATLSTGTNCQGNIITQDSITLVTGTTVNGGLYALTGAVTLDTNRITVPRMSSQQPTGTSPVSNSPTSASPPLVSQTTSRVFSGSGRISIPTTGTNVNDITTSLSVSITTGFSNSLTATTRVRNEATTTSSPNAISDFTSLSPTGNRTIASLEMEIPNTRLSSSNTTYKTFTANSTYWKFPATTMLSLLTITGPKPTSTQVQTVVSSNDSVISNGGTSCSQVTQYLSESYSHSSTVASLVTPTIPPAVSINTETRLAYQTPYLSLLLLAIIFALLVLL